MSALVAEMTQDTLRRLIAQTVRETMYQVLHEFRDPDDGLALQDWVVQRLESERFLTDQDLIPDEQMMAELGLWSETGV